jgi:cold-inducible RNA-binding protein
VLNKGKMKTKLFVGNLAPRVTRGMIESTFALHGSVSAVYLATNRITDRCRGFAFVTMDSEEGACKAMESLNGSMNNGRFIKVHEAPDGPDASVFKNYIPRREFRKLY